AGGYRRTPGGAITAAADRAADQAHGGARHQRHAHCRVPVHRRSGDPRAGLAAGQDQGEPAHRLASGTTHYHHQDHIQTKWSRDATADGVSTPRAGDEPRQRRQQVHTHHTLGAA
ncbi:hypothetical protein O3G_MSEX000251, partial [Manduca sexta]